MRGGVAIHQNATASTTEPATRNLLVLRDQTSSERSCSATTTAHPTASTIHDSYQNLNTVFIRPPSLRTVSISTPAWIAQPIASASGPSGLNRDAPRRCQATQPHPSANDALISNVSNPGRCHRYARATSDKPTTARWARVIHPHTVASAGR